MIVLGHLKGAEVTEGPANPVAIALVVAIVARLGAQDFRQFLGNAGFLGNTKLHGSIGKW